LHARHGDDRPPVRLVGPEYFASLLEGVLVVEFGHFADGDVDDPKLEIQDFLRSATVDLPEDRSSFFSLAPGGDDTGGFWQPMHQAELEERRYDS
jgi:hypothetical protein